MRLSKSLESAVMFANWCANNKIDPANAAGLITLAKRAFAAGERETYLPGNVADRERRRFDEAACAIFADRRNFAVMWDGLWPTLSIDGQAVYLPDIR